MSNPLHQQTDEPDFASMTERLSEHAETRFHHARLYLVEKASVAYAKSVSQRLLLLLVSLILVFAGISGSIWMGRKFHDAALGFGAMALCYVIALLLFLAIRKPVIERKITDVAVATLCAEHEDEEDDDETEA